MEFRLQSEGCSNFRDFITLLNSLLEATMPEITFMAANAYGPEPLLNRNPIITFKVKNRKPAAKDIKPRYRQTIKTELNETFQIFAQQFDYYVEFNVWGESSEQVDLILDKFEDVLLTYQGDLLRSGIQRMVFLEQGEDVEHSWKDKLICRPLQYLVRLERQTIVQDSLLKTITVRTGQGLVFKIKKEE